MVSLDLTMSVEKPLCFGKLMIPMVKDKKSFLHGVHIRSVLIGSEYPDKDTPFFYPAFSVWA